MNVLSRSSKAILAIVFVLMMIFPVAAIQSSQNDDLEMRYIGITRLWAGLDISGNGYSTCTGECEVRSGYTMEATMELQRKEGSSWKTIKTWYSSGDEVTFINNWYVASGYNYQVKLSVNVKNATGKTVETDTAYSSVEKY